MASLRDLLTVGADLCVGFRRVVHTPNPGPHTKVCPYSDLQSAL